MEDIPRDVPACSARIEAGQPLAEALAAGGVVCLGPGVHAGPLVLKTSVTLRGEVGAVLDGGGTGSVLRVEDDDLVVRVEALTLRGGSAESGGGLALTGYSDVLLLQCVVEGNRARGLGDSAGGGGGVYATRGTIRIEGGMFRTNRAAFGSDLFVTGVAEAIVTNTPLAGDVVAREGAHLTLNAVNVGGAVQARGTTTRAPTVRVKGGTVKGGVQNDPRLPANVEILP